MRLVVGTTHPVPLASSLPRAVLWGQGGSAVENESEPPQEFDN